MSTPKQLYYEKRAKLLVSNLKSRRFDAVYCATAAEALREALRRIPEGARVGWGGAMSANQIGLMNALRSGNYNCIDRDAAKTPESKRAAEMACLQADVFLTGANAISMDGQMVNIDGIGNRVAAMIYGPSTVLVIAGMNKVCDTLEEAIHRARTVAAPINQQRFLGQTPCAVTGVCADCKSPACICNQIVITRGSRVPERIQFILVGEELGF